MSRAETLSNMAIAAETAFGFRNILHNGDFRIQQRGAVFSGVSESQITFDRWRATIGGAGTVNLIDGGPFSGVSRNSVRVGRSAGTGAFGIYQSIERAEFDRLKGKTVTFSGYLLKDPGLAGNITCEIRTVTAEGGTVAVNTASVNIAASGMSGVTRFTVSLAIPSGSAALGMMAQIAASSQAGGATVGFYATGLQLEDSPVATPYEWRPTQIELAICQRFCEKIGGDANPTAYWSGYSAAGANFGHFVPFKVQKRSVPTALTVSGSISTTNASASVADNATTGGFMLTGTASAAGTAAIYLSGSGNYVIAESDL